MVAPALIGGLIAGGGSIAGGLIGAAQANKAQKRAEAMAREAASQYGGINVPTAEELYAQLQQLVSAGELTPEQAQAILVEKSAYEGVDTSGGEGREAEMAALQELRQITEGGGLTAIDRAKIADIQEQIGTSNRGAQEAIMQQASQRGIAGSGLDFANRMLAQQTSAQEGSKQGLQTAADAERRALEAIVAQGSAGSRISQSDFERQAKVAEAQDLISKFNAANKQQVELGNVSARQGVQEKNLAEKQRLMDYNTQQENMNRLRKGDLAQQEFENKMALAGGKASALTGAAQMAGQRAQSQQDMYGRLIGAGGQIVGATAPYWGTQDVKKKKEEDI